MSEFSIEYLNYCINTRRRGNSSTVQNIPGTRHSEKLQMFAYRSAEMIFKLHVFRAVALLMVGICICNHVQFNNYLIF
jgi:hypothetical protein